MAVKTAQGVGSATASDYMDQVTALQSSMDAVVASEQKKTEDDAAAAQSDRSTSIVPRQVSQTRPQFCAQKWLRWKR
ncbi:hypothetical protein [uncultured Bifidobacterium sp.]|uniref:hypothetical protein n=1 Tax=uncultured Bifidobacterium sp. TaxID=165187 RepID=UPI002628D8F2|nr:hypothetical protein [uncultured Bifidobacterium sp.]